MLAAIWNLFRMDGPGDEAIEGITEVVFVGLMLGSAIVSPALLDAHGVWHLDMFIFIVSTGAIALKHQKDIKKYGPLVVPAAALLGLAAYSSARTPLRELVPWMPLALSLLLLLTTYSLPRLWPNFMESAQVDQQLALEEGLFQLPHGANEDTIRSVQIREGYEPRDQYHMVTRCCDRAIQEHQVCHMSRSASRVSRFSSLHESDVDLNEPLSYPLTRRVSPSRPSVFKNIDQAFEDAESQSSRFPVRSGWSCRHCRGNEGCLSSQDTQAAYWPSTAASGALLLEQDVSSTLIDP